MADHTQPESVGLPASVRPVLSYRTFFIYGNQSSSGRIQDTSSPPIRVTRRVRNHVGTLVNQVHRYEYNSYGRITKHTDPSAREKFYDYETTGVGTGINLEKIRQGGGGANILGQASYVSGSLRPATTVSASGHTTTITYVSGMPELVDTITDPEGNVTDYQYDVSGYLTSIQATNPSGAGLVTIYQVTARDAFKRISTDINSDGYQRSYVYDKLNRITQITHPDSSTEQFVYVKNGTSTKIIELAKYTDRGGRVTKYDYNGNRQLIKATDPLDGEVEYDWCLCGGLSSITDERDKVTTFSRDFEGRVTKKTYADGREINYTFHPESGRLNTVRYPEDSAATMTYTYYVDGNLYKIDYTNSPASGMAQERDVEYAYSSEYNRLTQRVDAASATWLYEYHPYSTNLSTADNGAGQIWTIAGPWADDTITYTYDDLGRVKERKVPGATTALDHAETYTYDSLERMKQDKNPLAEFNHTFIGSGFLVDKITAKVGATNRVETDYDWHTHANGRFLQQIKHTKTPGGTVIANHAYTWGTGGEKERIKTWQRVLPTNAAASTTDTGTQTFTHGLKGQLTGMTQTGGQPLHTYTYDAAGNRMSKWIDSAVTGYGTANNVNQIISATASGGGDAYTSSTYDKNGNLTEIVYPGNSRRKLTWYSSNRLKYLDIMAGSSLTNGDRRVEFIYGTDGQRRQMSYYTWNGSWGSKVDEYYMWADGEIIQKRNTATNSYNRTHYYSQGETRHTGSTTLSYHYYLTDHLGTIHGITSDLGVVQSSFKYDPYGSRTLLYGTESERGYTGHWRLKPSTATHPAAKELYLTWHRVYDPTHGKWLSRDPIGEADGINLYGYVGNGPVTHIDQDGRWGAAVWGAIVGGVVGIAAGGAEGGIKGAVAGGLGGAVGGTIAGLALGHPAAAAIGGAIGGAISSGVGQLLNGQNPLTGYGPAKMAGSALASGVAGNLGPKLGSQKCTDAMIGIASGLCASTWELLADGVEAMEDFLDQHTNETNDAIDEIDGWNDGWNP